MKTLPGVLSRSLGFLNPRRGCDRIEFQLLFKLLCLPPHPRTVCGEVRQRSRREPRTSSGIWIRLRRASLGIAFGLGLGLSGGLCQTAAPGPSLAAVVIGIEGRVEVLSAGASAWVPARPSHILDVGDQVRTLSQSRAILKLADEGAIRLRESSRMGFRPPRPTQ